MRITAPWSCVAKDGSNSSFLIRMLVLVEISCWDCAEGPEEAGIWGGRTFIGVWEQDAEIEMDREATEPAFEKWEGLNEFWKNSKTDIYWKPKEKNNYNHNMGTVLTIFQRPLKIFIVF